MERGWGMEMLGLPVLCRDPGTCCHQARWGVPISLPQGFPVLTFWVLSPLWEVGTEAAVRLAPRKRLWSAGLQSFEAILCLEVRPMRLSALTTMVC